MADQFTAGETFTEDEQVTFAKLNLAQTNLKFTSNAVDGSTTAISSEAIIVNSGGITATQLATDAVTTAKIASGAVVTLKIADDAVTVDKMAAESVDSDQYVDGSIRASHCNAAIITGQTELTAVPHLTEDKVLISNNGVLNSLSLMKYLPLPRAWGLVDWSTTLVTGITGSANVSTTATNLTAITGSSFSRRITFSGIAMNDTNYIVLLTSQGADSADWGGIDSIVLDKQTTYFTIGAKEHADYDTLKIGFVVFGTLS